MYRWQTMTLARAESVLARIDTPRTSHYDKDVLHLVGDILYRIGFKHFPEPEVSKTPEMDYSSPLSLIWVVDGRELAFEFSPPTVRFRMTPAEGIGRTGRLDPSNCVTEVRELAHWLLTGYRSPAAPPAASLAIDVTVHDEAKAAT